MPIQIFLKHNGTKTLDVEDTDTIAEVTEKVRTRLMLPRSERILLLKDGKQLAPETTVAAARITKECTLDVRTIPSKIDPAVCEALTHDLGAFLEGIRIDKYVVFIGVGSYDCNHGPASIMAQQCRKALFDYCAEHDFGLTILLIDPSFKIPWGYPHQFNSIEAQGWPTQPYDTQVDGTVRRFKNPAAKKTKRDFQIITYATGIREYSDVGSIVDRFHIAEFDLRQFSAKARQLSNFCLISGNFFDSHLRYDTPPHREQYVTIGNRSIVEACGFHWNA